MATARRRAGFVAGCLVFFGTTAVVDAAPTVAQMLGFRPKHEVDMTTPTAAEQAACKVELVKAGRGSGWVLKNEKGDVLRRYMDTNADNKIDVWSYYANGLEIYREVDSNFNDKVDQYRWLHTAGTRWGFDPVEDGKVKNWKVISPEEISQEVLQAVVKRDLARLQALLVTEADLKALELPAADANRIRESLKKVPAKFAETVAKLTALSDKVRWDHVELSTPQCLPADATGAKQDLVRYANGIVFYQAGEEGKGPIEAKGLQLGEMIQVGTAWKLIDAPAPGSVIRESGGGAGEGVVMNKALEQHYVALGELDKNPPAPTASPEAVRDHNVKRADILEKMIAEVAKMDAKDFKAEDRDQWLKQVADCLGVAAQNSVKTDEVALKRLGDLKAKVVKEQSPEVAAYVLYVEIMADYNRKIVDSEQSGPGVQKELLEKLGKFVQDYPQAENAPDALSQLGMISELMNDEDQARKWYDQFTKNYPTHPQAAKMKGALDRLTANGKELTLTGPTLAGSAFDLKTLKGKVIVVYYWASWNSPCAGDLEKLRTLQATHGAKGLEVVCVNLDNTAVEAKTFLQGKPAPLVHLFEPNGMAGRLGEQYGIMVLPTMFVIGKDGKVISHAEQMSTVEENIKKALN